MENMFLRAQLYVIQGKAVLMLNKISYSNGIGKVFNSNGLMVIYGVTEG